MRAEDCVCHKPPERVRHNRLSNKARRKKRLRRRAAKAFPKIVKPSGTVSLMSTSSTGIEPIFRGFYRRQIRG